MSFPLSISTHGVFNGVYYGGIILLLLKKKKKLLTPKKIIKSIIRKFTFYHVHDLRDTYNTSYTVYYVTHENQDVIYEYLCYVYTTYITAS